MFFKINWQSLFEYRLDIFIYSISSVVIPVISMTIWIAVAGSGAQLPINVQELVAYFLLVMVFSIATSVWGAHFIGESIKDGSFSKYLVKPYSLFTDYFVQNLSEKTYKLFMVCTVVAIIWIIADVRINTTFVRIILSMFSLAIAFVLKFLIDISIGLTTFWFHETDFLRGLYSLAGDFFSGKIIPVFLLPTSLFAFSYGSPFRYILSFPIEILLGRVQGSELIKGFLIQLIWLLTAYIVYKLLYKFGTKRYEGYRS